MGCYGFPSLQKVTNQQETGRYLRGGFDGRDWVRATVFGPSPVAFCEQREPHLALPDPKTTPEESCAVTQEQATGLGTPRGTSGTNRGACAGVVGASLLHPKEPLCPTNDWPS